MTLPQDLDAIIHQVDEADRRADEIAGRLTDEEFSWQPDGGRRWSVALCFDHLAVANAVYTAAMRAAVETARSRGWTRQGPGAPGFFGRKFVELLEPPATRRSNAPEKIFPKPNRTREEILRAYHAAHDEVRRLARECATLDTNRATFSNPFITLVKVRLSTAFHIICAHDRRHLWQAEQVVQELRSRTSVVR